MSKKDLIQKIINCCFADDSGNFWEKFENWKPGESFYTSYIDPDYKSKKLYKFHKFLWNKQELKQVKVIWNRYAYELIGINDKEFRLGSDSIISIYWHWAGKNCPYKNMQNIINKIEPNEVSLKKFIRDYLQQANTIGGFIVFPKHTDSINQKRGTSNKIYDRFDLTLECIRRYYTDSSLYTPLSYVLCKDKEFFDIFGSFENYIRFFCLDAWVNESYTAVYDLLSKDKTELPQQEWPEKILPCDYDEESQTSIWWTLYTNIMSRLDERNEKIENLLRECEEDELQNLYNDLETNCS